MRVPHLGGNHSANLCYQLKRDVLDRVSEANCVESISDRAKAGQLRTTFDPIRLGVDIRLESPTVTIMCYWQTPTIGPGLIIATRIQASTLAGIKMKTIPISALCTSNTPTGMRLNTSHFYSNMKRRRFDCGKSSTTSFQRSCPFTIDEMFATNHNH